MAGIHRVEQLPRHRVLVGQDGQLPYPVLAIPELLPQLPGNQLLPQPRARVYEVIPCLVSGIATAACGEAVQVGDELLHDRPGVIGQVAGHLAGVVLVAELETVGLLAGVIAHHQAHGPRGWLCGDLSEDLPVRAGCAVTLRRDFDTQLTEVRAADPGRDGHLRRTRCVGAQLEPHRPGIPVCRNMHGLLVIAEHVQPRGVHDENNVLAFWGHVEELEFRARRTRGHVNAGKQAERLADCNALRALAAQITRPRWGNPASVATTAGRHGHSRAAAGFIARSRLRPAAAPRLRRKASGARSWPVVRGPPPRAAWVRAGGRVVRGRRTSRWSWSVRGRRRPGPASAAACSSAPASRRLSSRPATAPGSSRGRGRRPGPASAAACSSRARLPQAVQQPGHGVRVVEGGVGGGPGPASAAACSCAPASRRLSSRLATSSGSSRGAWAADPGRPARRPARARPPPAGCPAAWPRRPGRRGGRGRRPGRPARRPARARPPSAGCPAGRPRSGSSGISLPAATTPTPSAYPGNRTARGSLMPNTTIARQSRRVTA